MRTTWFYEKHFGAAYHSQAVRILNNLLFPRIPPQVRMLDLCCGTGVLTQVLAEHFYSVVGIDGSEEMLQYARKRVPQAEFLGADVRCFHLPTQFHAAISTFDSLNHIIDLIALTKVFRNVHNALLERAIFLFDLNMEEAYLTQWNKSSTLVEAEKVCIVRGGYDSADKIGRTEITVFSQNDPSQRSHITLLQKCYSSDEVRSALNEAGFHEVKMYDAQKDLQMAGDIGIGRAFFCAQK